MVYQNSDRPPPIPTPYLESVLDSYTIFGILSQGTSDITGYDGKYGMHKRSKAKNRKLPSDAPASLSRDAGHRLWSIAAMSHDPDQLGFLRARQSTKKHPHQYIIPVRAFRTLPAFGNPMEEITLMSCVAGSWSMYRVYPYTVTVATKVSPSCYG